MSDNRDNLLLMIKNLIRREYSMRADITTNICNHIDNLNRDNIIYHTNRNKMMNLLSSHVLALNTSYNQSLRSYKTIGYVPDDIEQIFIDNLNFEGFYLYTSHNNVLKSQIQDFFSSVDKNVLELMSMVGSKSIADLLKLGIGNNFREIMGIDVDLCELKHYVQENKKNVNLQELLMKMHNSAALIDILINHFVPLKWVSVYKNLITPGLLF